MIQAVLASSSSSRAAAAHPLATVPVEATTGRNSKRQQWESESKKNKNKKKAELSRRFFAERRRGLPPVHAVCVEGGSASISGCEISRQGKARFG